MSNVSENRYLRLRLVISRVSLSCVDQVGGSYALNETRLRSFGVIVMNAMSEKERIKRELEALFSLQKLVSSLEHSNKHKLLHSIFDILYEDAFLEWEVNEDTEEREQERKVVAFKSSKQFIQWLKTAEEPEEDDDAEKQEGYLSVGRLNLMIV